MRAWIVAASLLAASPAVGQTSAESQRSQLLTWAREQSFMAFAAHAAHTCGHRDRAWLARVMQHLTTAETAAARDLPHALPGGGPQSAGVMQGAGIAGATLGQAEATYRRDSLCHAVREGQTLRFLDGLLTR